MHIFLQPPASGATEKGVTEKGNERIRSILEEAKNALVDEGFSGLSFRTIAKRAGVTVGNVTYYFPTKDRLLVELAGYIFDRWDVRFRRELPKTLTEKMDIFLYSIRYMIEENKRVKSSTLLLEMWTMANRSTSVMRMLDTFYARMRSWIEEMLLDINPMLSARKRIHPT
jgi:AcrR family transcriptional regulator